VSFERPEIERLGDSLFLSYETIAESTNTEGIAPPESWRSDDLKPWLLEQARNLVSHGEGINASSDLFQQGFDR
jgi:hypothetical protein